MISIGSMLSLGDGYYLDDYDDDVEVAPSPRLRHKQNLSQGHAKLPGTCITSENFCGHHLERMSHVVSRFLQGSAFVLAPVVIL